MKSFIKTLILTFCIIFGTISFANAEDNTCFVSAQIAPSYTLIMPQSITVPYTNSDTMEAYINFHDIIFENGYGLKVTMEHDNFKHTLNSSYEISYTTDFSETIITEKDTEVCFKVNLDDVSLALAPPGKYTSKVTLTITYIKL